MRLQLGICVIALCGTFSLLTGCEAEPGRVRVKRDQVVGVYEASFDKGRERLELKRDGTYVQEFQSPQRTIQHIGRWTIENHFLGGSDVSLIDAVVSENDAGGAPERIGFRTLNVHKRSGKLALALNEVADWYFDRVQ
jgi:hypothetical protein